MYSIYIAKNTVNGKCYIGVTSKTLEDRKRRHYKNVKGKNEHVFHKAIKKHGKDAFVWELLTQTDDWNEETRYIKEYNSHYLDGHGYNMTYGGEGTLGRDPWNKKLRGKDNKQSKEYLLTSPTGEQFHIRGIDSVTEFGLSKSGMRKSMRDGRPIQAGKRKGWQLQPLLANPTKYCYAFEA